MSAVKKHAIRLAALALAVFPVLGACGKAETKSVSPEDASGFVSLAEAVPDVILEIRYYSTYNFVGDRIAGYEEPCALLTCEAAEALKGAAADAMEQGYRLKVYDAYHPHEGVFLPGA